MSNTALCRTACAVVASLVTSGMVSAAITIDTVHVGNAGNVADPLTGYGSVSYEYDIGKYEVTAGQYKDFLNAVGGVDTYELYNPAMSDGGLLWGCCLGGGAFQGNSGFVLSCTQSSEGRVLPAPGFGFLPPKVVPTYSVLSDLFEVRTTNTGFSR